MEEYWIITGLIWNILIFSLVLSSARQVLMSRQKILMIQKKKLSQMNFVVSLLSSLTAYTHQPIKAFSCISVKKWPGVLLFFLRQLQVNLSNTSEWGEALWDFIIQIHQVECKWHVNQVERSCIVWNGGYLYCKKNNCVTSWLSMLCLSICFAFYT